MTTSAIGVVLADDHGVVRRGIHNFLTESGRTSVRYVIQERPDVALLEYSKTL